MPKAKLIPYPPPVNGVDKRTEGILLDPKLSPRLKNMQLFPSKLKKDLGYEKFGTNLPLPGNGMELIEFTAGDADVFNCALTTEYFYKYNSDNQLWMPLNNKRVLQDCEDATEWTASGGAAVADEATLSIIGTNSMKVTITGDFSGDAIIAYTNTVTTADISADTTNGSLGFWLRSDTALSSGDVYFIVSEAANGAKSSSYKTCTLAQDILADTWMFVAIDIDTTDLDAVASIGLWGVLDGSGTTIILYIDDICERTKFLGDEDNRWTYEIINDDDNTDPGFDASTALAFSNGAQANVYFWDGDSALIDELYFVDDWTSFALVKEIFQHYDHLLFYNYDNNFVRSSKWSDLGECEGGWATGTSGEQVLTNSKGQIMRVKPLGRLAVVFSSASISLQTYVGGNQIFTFDTMIPNLGLYAAKAVREFPLFIIFAGSDQRIYQYSGGKQALDIGRRVAEYLFDNLNVAQGNKITFGYDRARKRLYIFYPQSGETAGFNYFALNMAEKTFTWEEGRFEHGVRDFSIFANKTEYTCNGAYFANTIRNNCDDTANVGVRCNNVYLQVGYPMAVFITEDSYVYSLNQSQGYFDTTNIEAIIETPDFVIVPGTEEVSGRWIQYSFNACKAALPDIDSTVSVYYSTDYGDTWTELFNSPITLTEAWKEFQLELDVKTRRIRFKLVNSSGDFQFRGHATQVIEATIRD